MTNSNIHQAKQENRTKQFELIYHFTVTNMSRSNPSSPNTAIQVLRLLSDSPRHHAVYALELWLFCEARKIYSTIEKTEIQKVIQRQIIQPFVKQLSMRQSQNKKQYVESLVYKILQQMGF